MALCKEGVTYRNIQEQVKKNKDDIDAIRQGNLLMAQMGIKVVGHVSDVSELPDPVTYDGEYGDAFVIGEDKPYNFYIFTRPANGVENPYWFDLGEFPARGPRGETGAVGPVGPKGNDGLSLVVKTYDPNAASGQYIPGTPWLNAVTGNVFISNEDFTWTQVGNWKGPQGSTGLAGPTGATGPRGLTGPQGPRGEAGGFANFRGILANENLLPNPELMNKSDGFLVGLQPPYDAYVIIGDENNKATWQWANVASTAMPSMIVITAPTGILSEEEMLMIAQNDHVIITDNIHIYKMSEKIVDPNQGTEYWFVCVEVNDEFSNTILKIQVLPDGHYDTFTNALGSSYGVGNYQVNTFNKLHASSDLTVEGNAHFQEDLTVDGIIKGKLEQVLTLKHNIVVDDPNFSITIPFEKKYRKIVLIGTFTTSVNGPCYIRLYDENNNIVASSSNIALGPNLSYVFVNIECYGLPIIYSSTSTASYTSGNVSTNNSSTETIPCDGIKKMQLAMSSSLNEFAIGSAFKIFAME